MDTLDSRKQKAIEIADKFRIVQNNGKWTVPSQTSSEKYSVQFVKSIAICTCPDFELRRQHCKHILAVQIVVERESNPDGSTTVTETVTVSERKTYRQNWPAYNEAQTNEQDRFQVLLSDLCSGVETPAQAGRGRRTLPLSDAIFAAAYKVYSTVSGRRFMSDLREAQARGFIEKAPHYNSIFNYLENPQLTPILKQLIIQSSLPLKTVESDFAADSSGFSVSRFERWFDHKHGGTRFRRNWVKVHLMCGVKTNIVTAVEILDQNAADCPLLPPMVRTTAKNFRMQEVSADKAYLSVDNVRAIAKVRATPFIAFKSNSTGWGGAAGRNFNVKWNEMFHYFMYRRDEFLEHYHKRSNVETTFSMIKRKFGDSVRSKTDVAMINEALCKILCHNIVVLIHETVELGLEPIFWAEKRVAQ